MSAVLRDMQMLMARLNHLATSGITPIGSKATAQTLTFSTGQLSGSATFALPSGCAAGDVVTLTCLATGFAGFAWGAPSNSTVALAARSLGAYPIVVYTYTLTAADITAGSVSVPCTITTSGSWSIPVVGVVDADRGVSTQNLDVVGTFASGTLANGSSASCVAPGITTMKNGDLLRYCLFATVASVDSTVTPASGYTAGDMSFSTNAGFATTGYLKQSSAGGTGDAVPTLIPAGNGNWGIVLLSLRVKVTAITLSAAFPSSPHVGDAINFDVTATLTDGATGTPTITVDQLPAGLSLGSTSMVDATHYKATVSGTLTTVQNVTSTFGATGGSVSATPLVHAFSVTAASSAITFVGATTFTATSGNMALPAGCVAGDVVLFSYQGGGMPAPVGAGGTAVTLIAWAKLPLTTRGSAAFALALTATDIANGYVPLASNSNTVTAGVWRGVSITSITNVVGATNDTASSNPTVITAPSITTTVDGCMLVFLGWVDANQSSSGVFTTPDGFTDAKDNLAPFRNNTMAYKLQTTEGATGSVSGSYLATGSWPARGVLIALNPK